MGGRVYEDWGNGEGAVWGTVTRLRRGEYLELTGRLGTRGAVIGVITFALQPQGTGTLLRLTHRAAGEIGPETEGNYDRGWRDLPLILSHCGLGASPRGPGPPPDSPRPDR